MKKIGLFPLVLLGIGVLYLVGFIVRAFEPEPVVRQTYDRILDLQPVDSAVMYAAYERNGVAADNEYRGTVLVMGRAKDIGKDIRGVPYVLLGNNPDNPHGVQAMFDLGGPTGLERVSDGDQLKVLCLKNSGLVIMNVILRNCSLR